MLITNSSYGQDKDALCLREIIQCISAGLTPFLLSFLDYLAFMQYSKLWRHTWLDITSSAWQSLSLHILSVYLNFVNIRRRKQLFFCKIIEEGWSIMYIWHPLLPTYLPQDSRRWSHQIEVKGISGKSHGRQSYFSLLIWQRIQAKSIR